MPRFWEVKEYFLEEVAFKIAKPGKKRKKVPKGREISRYRDLEASELYNFRTENRSVRLECIS